ncbi:MAG: hypothetical protein ACPF8V_00715 [Luteibaculum sp.]
MAQNEAVVFISSDNSEAENPILEHPEIFVKRITQSLKSTPKLFGSTFLIKFKTNNSKEIISCEIVKGIDIELDNKIKAIVQKMNPNGLGLKANSTYLLPLNFSRVKSENLD